jgi:hypothetical protein
MTLHIVDVDKDFGEEIRPNNTKDRKKGSGKKSPDNFCQLIIMFHFKLCFINSSVG